MTNSNGHGQIEGRRLCLANLILCNGNIMEAKKIKCTYHGYTATKPALLSWGGGGDPREARCLYDRAKRGSLHQGGLGGGDWGGGGRCKPSPTPNGAGAELRKILNFSAARTPNIVFPGHLRTKILSFIKRKIRRISITMNILFMNILFMC